MTGLQFADRIKGLGDFPARAALRVTNAGPVKTILEARYRKAVAEHVRDLPALGVGDLDIVAALRRDGVCVTSLAALGLPGSDEILATGRRLAEDFAPEARENVRNGTDLNYVPAAAIASRPELFTWGLSDRLLDIVEVYLGLPAAYDGVNIIYTVADGRAVATRQWHRDWEDRSMLKIAVYCSDVTASGGPFEIIRRRDPTHGSGDSFHYAPATHDELARRLGADYEAEVVSCAGPKGTVIFADTAKYFHRGQPSFGADRMAMFFSYFARTPRHPFFCERSGLSRQQIAKLAVGLTPRQRAATQWRDTLPALVRLIPPARL